MARIDIKSSNTGGGGGGGNLQLAGGASMTTTLTAVTDTSNVASPLKLSTAAVQVTSPLRITTSDASGFYLDAEDSATNNRFSIKRDPSSQEVTLDFASNPTGSTALVGAIRTYGDGVNLSNAMSFREDGNVGIGTDSPGAKLDVHSAGATVAQFNKTGSGNSYIQQLTAGAAKWKHGFTSASGAFDIIDDVNALTRLSLLNTGQLKLNAYTSTSAFTGTTAGFLAFDASGNILSVASPATSPSGVAGSVQFSDGTNFASDATKFFWDDTNNRLGIGTNAPTEVLDLVRSSGQGAIRFFNTAHSINTIQSGSTFRIFNSTAGTPAASVGFFQNINNQIGINTNNPTASLNVQGSGSTSATTSLLVQNSASTQLMNMTDDGRMTIGSSGTNAGALLFQFPNVGTNGVIWGDSYSSKFGDITLSRGTGEMRFNTDTGGYYQTFRTSNVERMRIEGNGLIGIGTSSPNASSVVDVSSTSRGFLPPRMTTAQKNAIATPAAGLIVYDTNLNKLCVYTTAWETITSI